MKITSCSLIYNDEEIIDMMLMSVVQWADEVVIVDGGSTDLTVNIIKQFQEKYPGKIKLIDGPKENPDAYEKQLKDKYGRVMQNGHFGMMKQIALDHVTGDWIFWIDSDECLIDNAKETLIALTQNNQKIDCFDIEYIHFVHDFKHIDNSEAIHLGIARFHKKIDGIVFDKYNHSLPTANFKRGTHLKGLYIYHLGYALNLLDVWKRYKRNMIFSEMHMGINQCFWRDWHYYNYPKETSPFNPHALPTAIKERFDIGVYDRERATDEK